MREGFLFLKNSWNSVILLKILWKRRNSWKHLMSSCVNAGGIPPASHNRPGPVRPGRGGEGTPPPVSLPSPWLGQGYPPLPPPGQNRGTLPLPQKRTSDKRLGYPLPPLLCWRHIPVKTVPSRRTTYAGGNETGLYHLKHLLLSIYFEFCPGFSSILYLFPKFHLGYRSLSLLKFHTSDKTWGAFQELPRI